MQLLIDWLNDFVSVDTISSKEYITKFKLYSSNVYLLSIFIGFHKLSSSYIQIFDSSVEPSEGDVPLISRKVTAKNDVFMNFGVLGMKFNEGIYIALSDSRDQYRPNGYDFFVTITIRQF